MSEFIQWLVGLKAEDLAGSQSWRVGLASEYGNYAKLGLILVVVAIGYVVVRSYRREGDAPRLVKICLGTLRMLVVALALLLLLRPAIILRFSKTLRPAVVVLIDESLSMGNDDTYADNPHRDELAKSMNVHPDRLRELTRMDLIRKALLRRGGAMGEPVRNYPLICLRYSTDDPGRIPPPRAPTPATTAGGACPTRRPRRSGPCRRWGSSLISPRGYTTPWSTCRGVVWRP